MKKRIPFLVSFLLSIQVFAGFENKDQGAKSLGLAGAYSALSNSAWSLFANPAGLSNVGYREIGLFTTQPYGLSELRTISAVYAEPLSVGVLGFGVQQFGFDLYKETTVSGSFSHDISTSFSLGYTLNIHHAIIKNYGNATSFSVDAGFIYQPEEWLKLSTSVFNLSQSTIGESEELIPSVVRVGTSVRVIQELNFTTELYKQTGEKTDLRFGLDFSLHENISIYTGFSTNPDLAAAGLTLQFNGYQLDYSISNHPSLGITNGISIGFSFGEEDTHEQYYPMLEAPLYESYSAAKKNVSTGKKNSKTLLPNEIELNSATIEDILRLPGISKKMALEIIQKREIRSKYTIIDELLGISGMTEKKFEKIKPFIRIDK